MSVGVRYVFPLKSSLVFSLKHSHTHTKNHSEGVKGLTPEESHIYSNQISV
jgi:hypothetical protein